MGVPPVIILISRWDFPVHKNHLLGGTPMTMETPKWIIFHQEQQEMTGIDQTHPVQERNEKLKKAEAFSGRLLPQFGMAL